jgi:hypothetical protein
MICPAADRRAAQHDPAVEDPAIKALRNAVNIIEAVFEWRERVERAGGATSVAGMAACADMLEAFRKNQDRIENTSCSPRASLWHWQQPARQRSRADCGIRIGRPVDPEIAPALQRIAVIVEQGPAAPLSGSKRPAGRAN